MEIVNKTIEFCCPEVFCKTGVLKIFAKFAKKHMCQMLIFNVIKLQTDACIFVKNKALAHVFSCKFCEILRTAFL